MNEQKEKGPKPVFEYTTMAVKMGGEESNIWTGLKGRGLDRQSERDLIAMGRDGWELVEVISLAVKGLSSKWGSAVCFFKRPVAVRKTQTAGAVRPAGAALEAGEFDWLLSRQVMAEKIATAEGRLAGLTENDWRMITMAAFPEAIPAVEVYIAKAGQSGFNLTEAENERIKMFYSHLDRSDLLQAAYRLIEKSLWPTKGLELIKEHQMFDAPSILRLLGNEDRKVRMNALEAIFFLKEEYRPDDVSGLEEVRNCILEGFHESPVEEKKGMLGKVKRVWKCSNCGKDGCGENESECPSCMADRFGVSRELGGLQGLLGRIDRRLLVLRRQFGEGQETTITQPA